MPASFVSFLRVVAATLISVSGLGLIASLWVRELTELAVVDALLGAVYLIMGIGLFGQSRFSLFVAIVIPAAVSGVLWYTMQPLEQVYNLRITVDTVVICFSLIVLWHVRNHPSV